MTASTVAGVPTEYGTMSEGAVAWGPSARTTLGTGSRIAGTGRAQARHHIAPPVPTVRRRRVRAPSPGSGRRRDPSSTVHSSSVRVPTPWSSRAARRAVCRPRGRGQTRGACECRDESQRLGGRRPGSAAEHELAAHDGVVARVTGLGLLVGRLRASPSSRRRCGSAGWRRRGRPKVGGVVVGGRLLDDVSTEWRRRDRRARASRSRRGRAT